MKWFDINDKEPDIGDNVIAVGTWFGEISGRGEGDYVGIGVWKSGGYVSIDSDIYSTDIVDVTHWMPLPELPSA